MMSQSLPSLKRTQTCFWLALLTHLLFLAGYSVVLVLTPEKEEEETAIYIPAYVYQKPATQPGQERSQTNALLKNTPNAALATKKVTAEKIHDAHDAKTETGSKQQMLEKPNLFIKKNTAPESSAPNFVENKNVAKPLLKLLTQATAAHFTYPPIAQDFRMRGSVRIRFLLYPDGRVTQVSVVKSSGAGVLDEAALATIKAISPVGDVSVYINEPQYIEANLIFA